MSKPDLLRIFVDRCAVPLRVGVSAHERASPQTVVISVTCEAISAVPDPGWVHATRGTFMDYAAIVRFLREDLPKDPPSLLLESLAERVAAHVLSDSLVRRVTVRLEKPGCLPDTESVGVTLRRERLPTIGGP